MSCPATATTLERPEDLADKAVFTPEEFAARNAEVAEQVSLDNRPRDETGAYNEFWMERGALDLRTSLITDPADGRLPAPTSSETRRREDLAADRAAHSTDSYENRSAYDRCISRGLPGSYQITITDPSEYNASWTAAIPMTPLDGQLYEYACHEGNYAIGNILSGARAEEATNVRP